MKSLLYATATASTMLLAIGLTLSSCGKSNDQLNQDQSTSDTTATAPAPAAADFAVDMTAANIAAGHATYHTTCAPCHGEGGKGDGPAAIALNPKPRDHTNGAYMNKLTNEHLLTIVKGGGAQFGFPGMPAQPQLSDDTVKNVIAFVRSLATNPPYAPAATASK